MNGTNYRYCQLYEELEHFEKNGIPMQIDGTQASPMQIVTALMLREEGGYMRDYILNPKGYIESLTFVKINHNA